mmetsp:Transcript_29628/g.85218  ORF Transcript_29628/g.85218 Transcript_29628/m.85218 type:complete len:254 (+) Transcript_29628:197-958(+)
MPNVSYTSLSAPMTSPFSSFNMPKRMYLRAASQACPELIKNMFKEKHTELPPLTNISKPLKPNNWPITKGAPKLCTNGLTVSLKHSSAANLTKFANGLMCDAGNCLSVREATSGLSLQCSTTNFAMLMHDVKVFARNNMAKIIDAKSPARVNSDTSWPTLSLKFNPNAVYLSARSAPRRDVVAKKQFWPATTFPLWEVVVPIVAQTLARWCAISFTVVKCTKRLALFDTAPNAANDACQPVHAWDAQVSKTKP